MPLPGFQAAIAGALRRPSSVSGSYVTNSTNTNNQTGNYTFSNMSIGAEAPDRIVVAIVTMRNEVSPAPLPSNVTIGGVSAELAISETYPGGVTRVGIYWRKIPTGTTATVVVTPGGGTHQNCRVAIWRITGQSQDAPARTAKDITSGDRFMELTIDMPAGSFMVAGIATGSAYASGSWAWTGATERYDNVVEVYPYSGADYTATVDETPHNLSVLGNNTLINMPELVAAVWE